MKSFSNLSVWGLSVTIASYLLSCSDNKNDEPIIDPDLSAPVTIGFKDAPENLFGSSAYGENLYNGDITKGYIANVFRDVYAQFPINYGYNYDASFNMSWCYTLYNGGFALSNYHNMVEASYLNQLSVYNPSSPSGGNFVVAFGNSNATDPSSARFSDYDGCARVYLTNSQGFGVAKIGQETPVEGVSEKGVFKSVYLNNTTYTFLTMKNGDAYASALNEKNEGWFKVQFIAFEDNTPSGKPIGFTEAYLANFKQGQADGYKGIIEEWIKVDLSMLPECSILVVNFVGSDTGEWGLNTPAYCALDNFEISVINYKR